MAGSGQRADPCEVDSQINKFINRPTGFAPKVDTINNIEHTHEQTLNLSALSSQRLQL
jgi:hypothetical protein